VNAIRGRLAAGIAAFGLSCAVAAESADDLLAASKAAMRQNDAPRAAALLEKAVAIRPDNAELLYRLANAYGAMAEQSNPFTRATLAGKMKDACERAVRLDPGHVEARMTLIMFYTMAPALMGGSEAKAMEQAEEIRRRDAYQGHRAFGRLYTLQKKSDLARKEYLDAVREAPDSARAHSLLAYFLATSDKDYLHAVQESEKAVQLEPAYMPGWFRVGQVAALGGTNLAHGEEALKKYLAYEPKDNEPDIASAHFYLGQIYENQGRKTDARQSYGAALRVSPRTERYEQALKRVSS